jgi:LmbE family N-acetylglucosaminyl deacetylase
MSKIYIPDKASPKEAYRRTRQVAIVAHADDIEILALKPITETALGKKKSFFGIVAANNQGGPRRPEYKKLSGAKLEQIREREQSRAARLGNYSGVAFLRFASSDIRSPRKARQVEKSILELLEAILPDVIYTHSLFDIHPTHKALALRVISALKAMPPKKRPKQFYGMEVWGSLEWLPKRYKAAFDVSKGIKVIKKLLAVYKSQNYQSHRYDEAVLSRLRANAIFSDSHKFSKKEALIYGMDLSCLIKSSNLTAVAYIEKIIKDFLKEKKKIH